MHHEVTNRVKKGFGLSNTAGKRITLDGWGDIIVPDNVINIRWWGITEPTTKATTVVPGSIYFKKGSDMVVMFGYDHSESGWDFTREDMVNFGAAMGTRWDSEDPIEENSFLEALASIK